MHVVRTAYLTPDLGSGTNQLSWGLSQLAFLTERDSPAVDNSTPGRLLHTLNTRHAIATRLAGGVWCSGPRHIAMRDPRVAVTPENHCVGGRPAWRHRLAGRPTDYSERGRRETCKVPTSHAAQVPTATPPTGAIAFPRRPAGAAVSYWAPAPLSHRRAPRSREALSRKPTSSATAPAGSSKKDGAIATRS